MCIHTLEKWQHHHNFVSINEKGDRRTKQVLFLTVTTMIVEIVAGVVFGSMALLADGWHMGTWKRIISFACKNRLTIRVQPIRHIETDRSVFMAERT